MAEHGGKGHLYNNAGCRCLLCKAQWARHCADMRKGRAARLAADPRLAPHGVETTYFNWMCRCDACRGAHRHETARRAAKRRGNPFVCVPDCPYCRVEVAS